MSLLKTGDGCAHRMGPQRILTGKMTMAWHFLRSPTTFDAVLRFFPGERAAAAVHRYRTEFNPHISFYLIEPRVGEAKNTEIFPSVSSIWLKRTRPCQRDQRPALHWLHEQGEILSMPVSRTSRFAVA